VLGSLNGGQAITSDGATIDGAFCCYIEDGGRLRALYMSGTASSEVRDVRVLMRPRSSGQIVATQRGTNSIEVAGDFPATLRLAGCLVRVFNESRSKMYEIREATHVTEGRLRLTLSRSSLLAEGVALGFEDGVLLNSIPMPHVTPGCTVENVDSGSHWRLKKVGHVRHAGVDLILEPSASKSVLSEAFKNKSLFVYGYGPGDSVEIINSAFVDFSGSKPRVVSTGEVEVTRVRTSMSGWGTAL